MTLPTTPELPLTDASRRLRRRPGRPPRESRGFAGQGAPLEAASGAGTARHFATPLLPRGLSITAASAYSGIPARRLWALIAEGRLRAIRLPGMRRVLLDREDLDQLLDAHKAS